MPPARVPPVDRHTRSIRCSKRLGDLRRIGLAPWQEGAYSGRSGPAGSWPMPDMDGSNTYSCPSITRSPIPSISSARPRWLTFAYQRISQQIRLGNRARLRPLMRTAPSLQRRALLHRSKQLDRGSSRLRCLGSSRHPALQQQTLHELTCFSPGRNLDCRRACGGEMLQHGKGCTRQLH